MAVVGMEQPISLWIYQAQQSALHQFRLNPRFSYSKNLSVNNILMVEQASSVIWRDHAEARQTIAIMGSIGRIVGHG
jgi:hypothetical protein